MTRKDRDERDAAEAAMAANGTTTKRRVDPEMAHAYNEYVKDWNQRMNTFRHLQNEYMGRRGYRASDNIF